MKSEIFKLIFGIIGVNFADILGAMQRGLDQVYFNPLQKQIPDKFPTYEVTGII